MQRIPAAIVLVVLGVVLAACGAGPTGSGVAALASTVSASPGDGSPSPGPSDALAQALAYARCMRANGVPQWPDPDSQGLFDKAQIFHAAPNLTPQLEAAQTACEVLLPTTMRGPSPAELQQSWTNARAFALCMRGLGIPNAPDPVADRDGRPVFDLAGTGIDPKSPQVLAKAQQCQAQLHLSGLPAVTGAGS